MCAQHSICDKCLAVIFMLFLFFFFFASPTWFAKSEKNHITQCYAVFGEMDMFL